MAQVGIFTGARLVSPDKLGRLSLPAVLRNSVPGDPASRSLFVSKHEDSDCLVGAGEDRLVELNEQFRRQVAIAEQQGREFNRSAIRRRIFGPGEVFPMDKSGRFTLPDTLAELASFTGDVFFYGTGEFFEMWDPDVLMRQSGSDFEFAQQALQAAIRVREREGAQS